MKQSSNFDLYELLQSLVNLPQPYSQITLLSITSELLQFKVYKPTKSKYKKYKIICTVDQVMQQLRVLANAMLKFSVCKFAYNRNYYQSVGHEDRKIRLQILRIFSSITFQQILIEEPVHDLSTVFAHIIENLKVHKITFLHPACLKLIAKFILSLHQRLLSMHIIISIEISEVVEKELIYFTQSWINSLPFIKKQSLPKQEIRFGYPFNQSKVISNFIGRKEQISLFFKEKQVLTVRQLQQQGRFFILTSEYSLPSLISIIHLLFRDQKGVNLSIPCTDNSKLIEVAQYVSLNFRRGFRINIGNQFELSYNRMILNTINMNEIQVQSLLGIGTKAGIYQFVMYSELKYFENALDVFMKKPFIKFNYFMPLEELTPEVSLMIKKIEKQNTITRANAYSFAGILKHHGELGYVVVNSMFCALAEYGQ